ASPGAKPQSGITLNRGCRLFFADLKPNFAPLFSKNVADARSTSGKTNGPANRLDLPPGARHLNYSSPFWPLLGPAAFFGF
ncbi:MAG: hypothetical protein MUC97_18620, partial [Bernardetiaceae bacterium]|nr:hypothetical protein [Bernardetiaceae bacterium]